MRVKILGVIFILLNLSEINSQTLYVPSGTSGIGTSTVSGNVGIGTGSPDYKLTTNGYIKSFVSSNSSETGYIWGNPYNLWNLYKPGSSDNLYLLSYNGAGYVMSFNSINGNVGVGISDPTSKLSLNGDIYINSGIDDNHIYWGSHYMTLGTKPGDYAHNVLNLKPGGASEGMLYSAFNMYTANSTTNFDLKVQLCSAGKSFLNGGNIGIGTTDPQNLLDVNGTIHAREVKVDLTGWSDFVFHPSYKLKPLIDVEKYIKTNGHLEDIPSAAEVEKNGVNVGEMQAKLLQKVEELTLYVIELEKRIIDLEPKNLNSKKLSNPK